MFRSELDKNIERGLIERDLLDLDLYNLVIEGNYDSPMPPPKGQRVAKRDTAERDVHYADRETQPAETERSSEAKIYHNANEPVERPPVLGSPASTFPVEPEVPEARAKLNAERFAQGQPVTAAPTHQAGNTDYQDVTDIPAYLRRPNSKTGEMPTPNPQDYESGMASMPERYQPGTGRARNWDSYYGRAGAMQGARETAKEQADIRGDLRGLVDAEREGTRTTRVIARQEFEAGLKDKWFPKRAIGQLALWGANAKDRFTDWRQTSSDRAWTPGGQMKKDLAKTQQGAEIYAQKVAGSSGGSTPPAVAQAASAGRAIPRTSTAGSAPGPGNAGGISTGPISGNPDDPTNQEISAAQGRDSQLEKGSILSMQRTVRNERFKAGLNFGKMAVGSAMQVANSIADQKAK